MVADQHVVHYFMFAKCLRSGQANDQHFNPDRPISMLKPYMEYAVMPPAKKQLNKNSKLLKSFQRMTEEMLRLYTDGSMIRRGFCKIQHL